MLAIARPTKSLKALLLLPFFILIISGFVVPSDGSHGFLNIKALAFVSSVFCTGAYILLRKKLNANQWKFFCYLIASLVFLLIWMAIGIARDSTPWNSTWEQFKIFWLTITVVVLANYLYEEKLVSIQRFLKVMIYANFAYSFAKVIMVILLCIGFFDMWGIVARLGFRFMSMDITGNVPRFQTSMDISTPFLLFFFLKSRSFGIDWSKKFRFLYLSISTLAILLSFSRFLTFAGLLSVALHAFSTKHSISVFLRIVSVLTLFIVTAIAWIGIDEASAIIERRLFSYANYASDQTRREQVHALITEYIEVPIIGKGLGGYAEGAIRDPQLLYSYEVQWVAFLMQFGLLGISCLVASTALIANKILSHPLTREKIALFMLFLGWLASGFTNPFLISLTSGILYALFLLCGKHLSRRT